MSHSIELLLERYPAMLDPHTASPALREAYNSLRLAAMAQRRFERLAQDPTLVPQVVVLGPTQSGKSSLVNLILDNTVAGVSALAGHTVHAQGFALQTEGEDRDAVADLFAPMQRTSPDQLRDTQLERFVLEAVMGGPNALLRQGIVWDSPDFDSVASSGYRSAVLKLAALADVIVLALSKDKYADRTVWDLLEHLNVLDKPMIVCLNKLESNDRETVINAFQERFQRQFGKTAPPLVSLPWIARGPIERHRPALAVAGEQHREPPAHSGFDSTPEFDDNTRRALEQAIAQALSQVDRAAQRHATSQYIDHWWPHWLAPVEQEAAAHANWEHTVRQELDKALERYTELYLDQPDKFDSFNRTLAELLVLLEIPGLAATLQKTRALVTWPARRLLGLGRQVLQGDSAPTAHNLEQDVLVEIATRVHHRLQAHIFEARHAAPEQGAWWDALQEVFVREEHALRTRFEGAAVDYQTAFQYDIEQSAKALHDELKNQPKLLNSLRAARVSADAAAVALAVKTGGLAPHDLVLAPAMLSVTTLLTESALGHYVDSVKRKLRRSQREQVRLQLLEAILYRHYSSTLPDTLDDRGLLGLDPTVLEPPRLAA